MRKFRQVRVQHQNADDEVGEKIGIWRSKRPKTTGDDGADAWVESDATGACAARPYVSLAARKRLRVLDGPVPVPRPSQAASAARPSVSR